MQTIMNNTMRLAVLLLLAASVAIAAEIKVAAVKGEVSVRRGTSEQWTAVAAGDVLKPEDSMRLGKKASATIVTDQNRRLTIPENVVLDLADIRMLTQEELLLQLAMERVRSVPDRKGGNDLAIPRTTTVHGSDKSAPESVRGSAVPGDGVLRLNGVGVLYKNGYYGTSVLRAKEIYRLIPSLAENVESRLLVASALEKMGVTGEALGEYYDIAGKQLTEAQKAVVEARIAALKRATGSR